MGQGSKRSKANSTRRKLLLGAGGAAAAAAASPFWINIGHAQPKTPIKVGFPVPLTGPFGTEAQDQVRCAEIAVREFNESGGLDGRMAELLVRDDKLNPGEAATRTLELIEKDKVNFVVGSLSAAVQLSVNNVCKERGIIYNSISQSDAINEVKDFSKYTFHEAMNPHMTSGAVARYAIPKFGKRVVFFVPDYAYGHEMLRGFQRAGKEFGLETLADLRFPLGTSDFSSFFPRVQALRPDILCMINFGRDQVNGIKQAHDFGITKQTKIITPVLLISARMAAGPESFEGVVGATSYYWKIEDKVASAKAFNDRYRKAHPGGVPSDYGALGYAGVRTVLTAARNAKATDTDKVIAAMRTLKYDFYKGPQYYRQCDHQSVQSIALLQSKAANRLGADKNDVFDVIGIENPSEKVLRTCGELGHKV
jgi:branched-chain amino acid transport system substrate-binding protein